MTSKKSPKISIITPNFNGGQFLTETIESVLSQNYDNLEYIIIDGASTDDSVEIIRKFEKHLSYWISEKDTGQSSAINKGFRRATGDLMNWLNSDDTLVEGSLETVAHHFQENEYDVIAGKCRHFKGEETVAVGGTVIQPTVEQTICRYAMGQPSHFYRRKILENIGEVNESLHYSMDRELWYRYIAMYGIDNVKIIDDVLSNFRLHSASKTVSEEDGFELEKSHLFYSMLNSLDSSAKLKDLFIRDDDRAAVQFNIRALDKKKFEYELCKYLGNSNFEKKKFKMARSFLNQAVRSKFEFKLLLKMWYCDLV